MSELGVLKTLRSHDQPGIRSVRFGCLAVLILNRTSRFERTYILAFLRLALYLFADEPKGNHCLNGASLE